MTSSDNKRIAKNTLYLYIRMFVALVVALYSTRVVLRVLGQSDYGLYNVVAGVVTMISMLNGALAIGTQRFLSFAMGEHDADKLGKSFSIALWLHIKIALLVLLICETVGLWFVNSKLNIPVGRELAAFWVYQFSVIGFILSLVLLPFQACIIANERMNIYAFMSIFDVFMKLLIVFLIPLVNVDKLFFYAFLVLLIQITSFAIYFFYCKSNFSECKLRPQKEPHLRKEMVSYIGWNLIGGTMAPVTNTGVNILLNIFCGTVVNAARAISVSVNTQIFAFVTNLQMAANPQIVKLYAEKEFDKFYKLLFNNGRIAIYLFLFIAIPAFIEVDFILKIWLGDYPEYTAVFIRIILIQSFVATLNKPVNMSVHASGNIKWLNISNGICMLVVLPLTYFALKVGCSPVVVYWINVGFYISDNICNLIFSHKYTKLPVMEYLKKTYLNSLVGAVLMYFPPYVVSLLSKEGWGGFLTVCTVSVVSSIIVIYFWGLTPEMKQSLLLKISQTYNKVIKHEDISGHNNI